MRAEGVDNDLGERDRSDRGLGFRRGQVGRPAGQGDQLPVDGQLSAQEVDPVDAEAEGLTLPESGAGGEDHQGAVAIRHRLGEGLDRVDGQWLDPLPRVLRQLRPEARRGDDAAIADGGLEDRGEDPVDDAHRAGRQGAGQSLHEALDIAREHRGELAVAEHRIDVQPQHRLDVRGRGGPVDLARPPLFGVVPDRLAAGVRVHELPGDECCGDLVQPALSVDLAREGPGLLRAVGSRPVARPPRPVGALVDAGHQ
nr:hypothetical protein [Geodermatophilus bullaregiensis]